MLEVILRVRTSQDGCFKAETLLPSSDESVRITASTLEELHHEARGALIEHLGEAHCAYKVRLRHQTPLAPRTMYRIREGAAHLHPQPRKLLGMIVAEAIF